MERNRLICIDIGGTAIKYGILESDQTVLFADETPTEALKGGPALARKVHDLTAQLLKREPEAKGIAISTAGVVDSIHAQIVHASSAIPSYVGISYKKELADFGLPVEAENDVNCAGLSEYASGAARDASSALVLTIGTGIGGCFIEDGHLLTGNSFSACEVGYLPFEDATFQEKAATTALVANVARRKGEPVEEWNGRRIFELADQGDVVCQEEIRDLGRRLGRGVAMICYILNPHTVVLGGGIMACEKELRPWIEEGFLQGSIPLIAHSTDLRFASHQNAAGMKGALVHFLQKHPDLAR